MASYLVYTLLHWDIGIVFVVTIMIGQSHVIFGDVDWAAADTMCGPLETQSGNQEVQDHSNTKKQK